MNTQNLGRAIALIGVTAVWMPFVLLTGYLGIWWIGTGLGDANVLPAAFGCCVAIALPLVALWALRGAGAARAIILVAVVIAIPLVWAWLVSGLGPHSEPVDLMTTVAAVGAVITAVGVAQGIRSGGVDAAAN